MANLTQNRAVVAYTTIMNMGQKVSGKPAFALFKLKQTLKGIVEFQSEEEMKLVEKYGATVTEDGRILPGDDAEKFAELVKEKEELGNMECDVVPVEIDLDSIPEITMNEIEALDGFVIFK